MNTHDGALLGVEVTCREYLWGILISVPVTVFVAEQL